MAWWPSCAAGSKWPQSEAGHLEFHRRTLVGVAVVSPDLAHCQQVLDACERLVAQHPEFEMIGARQRFIGEDD